MEDEHQAFQTLEGQIKRVRITYTPGELRSVVKRETCLYWTYVASSLLRLAKDIQEVSRLIDVSAQITEIPSIASISFPNPENEAIPSKFLITVPKFYPHNAPIVQCLDYGVLPFSSYFDENGRLNHRIISDWRAVYSLLTVIQSLRELREVYSDGMKSGMIGGSFTDIEDDTSSVMEEEP